MRKHIAGYIKNMKDASKYRDIINKIDRKDELIACLTEYFKTIQNKIKSSKYTTLFMYGKEGKLSGEDQYKSSF